MYEENASKKKRLIILAMVIFIAFGVVWYIIAQNQIVSPVPESGESGERVILITPQPTPTSEAPMPSPTLTEEEKAKADEESAVDTTETPSETPSVKPTTKPTTKPTAEPTTTE